MDQRSAHDPPRLPLRIPVVVHGHTAGGTPTLRGGDSIIRPGDAAYDREYHFAVFALRRYAVPMPYAGEVAAHTETAARATP